MAVVHDCHRVNDLTYPPKPKRNVSPALAGLVLTVGVAASPFGAAFGSFTLYWDLGWSAVHAQLVFLAVAPTVLWATAWFSIWAARLRGPRRFTYRFPIPVLALIVVACYGIALSPLYWGIVHGGLGDGDSGGELSVVLLIVLLTAAVIAATAVCRPIEDPAAAFADLRPRGVTETDVVACREVEEATGDHVREVVQLSEPNPLVEELEVEDGMRVRYALRNGEWVETHLQLQQLRLDFGRDEMAAAAGDGRDREELEVGDGPAYRFRSPDGEEDFVWFAVDDRFVVEVRSSKALGHRVRLDLARSALSRLR
ncbi:hypothetical protein [Salininema proteolyticum]|uniref:Uncharacterized protein n=1 Tax=Salininema proteolyticum TaxID=1607685 RepID=A0ABV8TWY9_9ACTN